MTEAGWNHYLLLHLAQLMQAVAASLAAAWAASCLPPALSAQLHATSHVRLASQWQSYSTRDCRTGHHDSRHTLLANSSAWQVVYWIHLHNQIQAQQTIAACNSVGLFTKPIIQITSTLTICLLSDATPTGD